MITIAFSAISFSSTFITTEKLFDTSLSHKLRNVFGRFQIEADGEYFKFRSESDWDGYEDDAPKVKPVKFDIQI